MLGCYEGKVPAVTTASTVRITSETTQISAEDILHGSMLLAAYKDRNSVSAEILSPVMTDTVPTPSCFMPHGSSLAANYKMRRNTGTYSILQADGVSYIISSSLSLILIALINILFW